MANSRLLYCFLSDVTNISQMEEIRETGNSPGLEYIHLKEYCFLPKIRMTNLSSEYSRMKENKDKEFPHS